MVFRRLCGALALLFGCMLSPAWAADMAPEQEFTKRGMDGCLKCHGGASEAPVVSVLHTSHFVTGDPNTPAEKQTCESCHGPSSEHAKKLADGEQRVPPTINYGPNLPKSPIADRNNTCLSCHENGQVMNWRGAAHDSDDVGCHDCHNSHNSRDPVLKKTTEADVCYKCHTNTRIEANKPHRHPIREGKVTCSDCHNPHGNSNHVSLLKATTNDTCKSCHTEKRGPFLWEHQPVQEDCTNCHYAHGGVNERLLKVARPFLCQQCHTEAGATHQSGFYDFTDLDGGPLEARIGGKGCTNCHSQIHGSNKADRRGSAFVH